MKIKLIITTLLIFLSVPLTAGEKPGQILNKKVVLIVAGLPGTGKTTLLTKLHQKVLNSTFIDKDVINVSLLQDEPYFSDYYFKYVRDQSYAVMLDLAKLNMQNNRLVILDGQFGDKLLKEPFASFLNSQDFEVKVAYCYCSEDVNKERLVARASPRDDDKLQDFETYFAKTTEVHERVLKEVPHLSISTEEPIEDNLDRMLTYLSE